jgi:hypothetical protein
MKHIITLLNIFAMTTLNINAQDLQKYKWENRLVLIFAENENQEVYQNQLKELKSSKEGLTDRKILIYQILPEKFKIGLTLETNWEKSNKLFDNIINDDTQFKVVLIGLDGGIKLQQNELLSTEKLFVTIDKMPMRRIEIKNKTK